MGLFDFLKGYTAEERALIDQTAEGLAGVLPPAQARELAQSFVDGSIRDSKTARTYDRPRNLGDTMVRFVRGDLQPDAGFTRMWKLLSDDGVTEEDLRQWWNQSEVERRVWRWVDLYYIASSTEVKKEQGFSDEVATREIKRNFLICGTWDEILAPTWAGEDRLVPYEIKARALRYILQAPEVVKAEAEEFSTMNAYIRSLARSGRLK